MPLVEEEDIWRGQDGATLEQMYKYAPERQIALLELVVNIALRISAEELVMNPRIRTNFEAFASRGMIADGKNEEDFNKAMSTRAVGQGVLRQDMVDFSVRGAQERVKRLIDAGVLKQAVDLVPEDELEEFRQTKREYTTTMDTYQHDVEVFMKGLDKKLEAVRLATADLRESYEDLNISRESFDQVSAYISRTVEELDDEQTKALLGPAAQRVATARRILLTEAHDAGILAEGGSLEERVEGILNALDGIDQYIYDINEYRDGLRSDFPVIPEHIRDLELIAGVEFPEKPDLEFPREPWVQFVKNLHLGISLFETDVKRWMRAIAKMESRNGDQTHDLDIDKDPERSRDITDINRVTVIYGSIRVANRFSELLEESGYDYSDRGFGVRPSGFTVRMMKVGLPNSEVVPKQDGEFDSYTYGAEIQGVDPWSLLAKVVSDEVYRVQRLTTGGDKTSGEYSKDVVNFRAEDAQALVAGFNRMIALFARFETDEKFDFTGDFLSTIEERVKEQMVETFSEGHVAQLMSGHEDQYPDPAVLLGLAVHLFKTEDFESYDFNYELTDTPLTVEGIIDETGTPRQDELSRIYDILKRMQQSLHTASAWHAREHGGEEWAMQYFNLAIGRNDYLEGIGLGEEKISEAMLPEDIVPVGIAHGESHSHQRI